MPKQLLTEARLVQPQFAELADRLAAELGDGQADYQPIIYERRYANGRRNVTVVWDEWQAVPLAQRSRVIAKAYELAEGLSAADSVGVAIGYTVPEAHASGLLPFAVWPVVRKSDPVDLEQCVAAMAELGGSRLFRPDQVHLRFASLEEAERCRDRLAERLPAGHEVWTIGQDLVPVEVA